MRQNQKSTMLEQDNNKYFFAKKALAVFIAVMFVALAGLPCFAHAMELSKSPLNPKPIKRISNYLSTPSKYESIDTIIEKDFPGGLPVQKAYKNINDAVYQALLQTSKEFSDTAIIVHYPQGFVAQDINDTIRKWATTAFLDPLSWEAEKIIEDKDEDEQEEQEEQRKDYYSYYTTYLLSFVQKKAVSIVFDNCRYTGGAHELWSSHSLSFDLTTGKPITLNQLFLSMETIERVAKWLSTKQLKSSWGPLEKIIPGNKPGTEEITPADIVMDHIILLPEGLRIFFDPYIKSSFSMGTTTITIPRSEFKNLGIAETFWQ